VLCGGLMSAAPEGPRYDGGGSNLALHEACDNTADFLHRPADQRWLLRIMRRPLFGGAAVLTLRRMAVSITRIVVEAEFVSGCLEAILDGPAPSFHIDQNRNRGGGGAPRGELGFGRSRWIASEVGQAVEHDTGHFDGIRRVRGRVGNHALPEGTAHCGQGISKGR
jgi:hypothetical protein